MQDLSRDYNSYKTLKATGLRPNGFLRWRTCCLSLWILVAFAVQTFSASVVADPNKPQETNKQRELYQRLEELIRQLGQERSTYYTQKAQHEAQIEKARENRKILQDELDELRRQETESDQQLREYEAEVDDLNKQLVLKASLENFLREQIQPFLTSQRTAIINGIPYKQQERITRLEAAYNDVNTPIRISAADQLRYIWSYAQEELRLTSSSETYTARTKTEDESFPFARFFRVGHQILGYITEDGQQAAIWSSLPRHEDWMFITDKNQLSQIRSAVEILDLRQAPKLVMLPIPLRSTSSDEGGSNASP